jgi:AcrR family transcriptional regulator
MNEATASAAVRLPGPERRRQLLATARKAFAEGGFHETSMNDIARAAGVTKPVVYQRFASKRDLYKEVLEDIGERLQAEVIESAARAVSPREQVEAGFAAYIDFVRADPDGFRLLFSGASRENDEWAEIAKSVERSVAESIANLIAVEGMSTSHRLALAHGVVGIAEGMVRFWQSEDSHGLEPDDLLRDLTTLAWVGLRGL